MELRVAVHLRLVDEEELVALDRRRDVLGERLPLLDVDARLFVEEPDLAARALLRERERFLCRFEERTRLAGVDREVRHADRRAHVERLLVEAHRLFEDLEEATRVDRRVLRRRDSDLHDREDVAGDASDERLRSRLALETSREDAQHVVARARTRFGVEVSEVIEAETDERHARRLAGPLVRLNRGAEVHEERRAVREPRRRVVRVEVLLLFGEHAEAVAGEADPTEHAEDEDVHEGVGHEAPTRGVPDGSGVLVHDENADDIVPRVHNRGEGRECRVVGRGPDHAAVIEVERDARMDAQSRAGRSAGPRT